MLHDKKFYSRQSLVDFCWSFRIATQFSMTWLPFNILCYIDTCLNEYLNTYLVIIPFYANDRYDPAKSHQNFHYQISFQILWIRNQKGVSFFMGNITGEFTFWNPRQQRLLLAQLVRLLLSSSKKRVSYFLLSIKMLKIFHTAKFTMLICSPRQTHRLKSFLDMRHVL